MAALVEQGVDIRGEAGVGYRLQHGAELPPVQLDLHEVQALVFGARLAARYSDPELRAAARSSIDKLAAVLPAGQRAWLQTTPLFTPMAYTAPPGPEALSVLRRAIRQGLRVQCTYVDARDQHTQREVLPLGLWLWTDTWTCGAWCALRGDYRSFRVDRMHDLTVAEQPYPMDAQHTVQTLLAAYGR